MGGPRNMSTQTSYFSQIIPLHPPLPPPCSLLRPKPLPLPNHLLAPILRPLYLGIVNRQLAMEIKGSEWENDLQDLLFGDRQDTAIEKKRVHWAESIQVFELEEHEGTEELYQEEHDKEKEGQIRNNNNQTVNCKTCVSSSSLDPAPIEEISPPFLHQLVKDGTSIGPESEFEVPFPSRPTFKFEPEISEEEFSPPFPTRKRSE